MSKAPEKKDKKAKKRTKEEAKQAPDATTPTAVTTKSKASDMTRDQIDARVKEIWIDVYKYPLKDNKYDLDHTLYYAAKKQRHTYIDELVAMGADVNRLRSEGYFEATPLSICLSKGVRSSDAHGEAQKAARNKDSKLYKTVAKLVEHGASLTEITIKRAAGQGGQNMPESLVISPIINAIHAKSVHVVRLLLEHGVNPNPILGENRLSPIEVAFEGGDPDIVDVLLEFKASNNVPTAIYCATFSNQLLVVQKAISAITNADVNIVVKNAQTGRQQSPLMLAVANSNIDIIKALLSRQDIEVNKRNDRGETALSFLFPNHAVDVACDIFSLLFSAGADTEVPSVSSPTQTILSAALESHHLSKLALLIAEKNPKAVTTQTLVSAINSGEIETMRILIKGGGDVNGIVDLESGDTLLHYTARNDHAQEAGVLLKAGAKSDAQNKKGETPLDLATALENDEVAETIRIGEYKAPKATASLISNVKAMWVGNSGAGKTSLIMTFSGQSFPDPNQYLPYRYDDTPTKRIIHKGRTMDLSMWDTFAREDGERLMALSFPQTDVFLLCIGIDAPKSTQEMTGRWLPLVKYHCPTTPMILVGMKSDIRGDPAVRQKLAERFKRGFWTQEEGEAYAKEIGAVKYVECSAKTGLGVNRLLKEISNASLEASPPKPQKKGACILS